MRKVRLNMVGTFFAALAVFMLAGCGGGSSDPNTSVRKGGFFYRLQSAYTVVETGERLDFDIVVACNVTVTSHSYTGSSYVAERAPEVYGRPTSNGAAVMIKTPRLCQQIAFDKGHVPDDFLAYAIWFDDVNDLSFGWGYATQGAYERENTKLAYHTGKITRTTREAWEAWREKAAAEYEQVGALPGPWGYVWPQNDEAWKEYRRVIAVNNGNFLGTDCRVWPFMPLPAEATAMIEEAAANDPDAIVTDDFIFVKKPEALRELDQKIRKQFQDVEVDFGGYKARPRRGGGEGTSLKPPARGYVVSSGSRYQGGYAEHYPYLRYIARKPGTGKFSASGYTRQVLYGPEWKGLDACGYPAPRGGDESHSVFLDEAAATPPYRTYPIYINQELWVKNGAEICGGYNCYPTSYSRKEHFRWGG